ncbi:MAG: homoserine dehydrogenase, partial [Desulfobulbaceae bacterium]|nr:homoserine dehydrogenase [Desulfobulbaceae bacterium]
MKEIRVGLIGFGTVGSGLAEVLLSQGSRIEKRSGLSVRLVKVADIGIKTLPEQFAGVGLTRDAAELINDPNIDIIVELIGGIQPAKTFVLQAIEAGKHVVTANKALLSQEGAEIFAAAAAKGVEVGFEASVGGGIPVIKSLKEGLVANRI